MPLPPCRENDCPFCRIAEVYPPGSSVLTVNERSTADPPVAYTLLSAPHVFAFLDHAPISRGHVLIATRQHRVKLSDTSIEEGQAIGAWLGIVSRAVITAVGGTDSQTHASEHELGDWNVVQNNGARAAQVVPHVHFHIIPRTSDVPEVKARSWTVFGRGQREELDDDDAAILQSQIQHCLRQELDALGRREGPRVVEALLGNQKAASSLVKL